MTVLEFTLLVFAVALVAGFFGSLTGARILPELRSALLRKIFGAVVFVLAIEMIYEGLVKVV